MTKDLAALAEGDDVVSVDSAAFIRAIREKL